MRLCKHHKDQIVRDVTTATFKERKEKLTAREDELARMAYDRIYEPHVQNLMERLPAAFFQSKGHVYIKIGAMRTEQFDLLSSRRVAACDHYYETPRLALDTDDVVAKHFVEHLERREQLKKDREQFKRKMTEFLAPIVTTQRLLRDWPEGLAHYKMLLDEPTPNLPAVTGAQITELIGRMKG